MLLDDCLFCKIIRGELPCEKVYEDDYVLAIKDIHPMTAFHVLLLPKTHIENYMDARLEADQLDAFDAKCLLHMHLAAYEIAKQYDLASKGGFRIIQNNGAGVGQSVMHLHWHLTAGEDLNTGLIKAIEGLEKTRQQHE